MNQSSSNDEICAEITRKEFLSRMSHEMRTPINAILGLTAIAQQNINDAQAVSASLSKIDSSAKFLLALINDVLDMSNIQSGKMILRNDDIYFREFIEEINVIMRSQAMDADVDYNSVINGPIDDVYVGDAKKLKQVLVNIISNAVKFTSAGGRVRFVIQMESKNTEYAVIRFKISDTGIGIDKNYMQYLFDAFSQENGGLTAQYGGTGLGLAICKSLVELMDGKIDVVSRKGVGSVFIVEVKLGVSTKADKRSRVRAGQIKQNYDFSGRRVLIADDHKINIDIAKNLLSSTGAIVDCAFNGEEAVGQYLVSEEFYYDAVLMDIRMPVMDGLCAAKKIRESGRADSKSVPVIAMTANAFEEDIEKSKESGMNAHLAKPIDPIVLFTSLQRHMDNRDKLISKMILSADIKTSQL
ncbi:MAG: ATP-binding protein [Oscillospiraceae bacterium]|nr:ATP-binding protein [Oscillospiraceae bacterium]